MFLDNSQILTEAFTRGFIGFWEKLQDVFHNSPVILKSSARPKSIVTLVTILSLSVSTVNFFAMFKMPFPYTRIWEDKKAHDMLKLFRFYNPKQLPSLLRGHHGPY